MKAVSEIPIGSIFDLTFQKTQIVYIYKAAAAAGVLPRNIEIMLNGNEVVFKRLKAPLLV